MSSDDTGSAIPHGAVKPGSYNCTWHLDGREVPGTVELAGGRFPHGTAKFMLASCAIPHGLAFPRIEQRDRVEGFIDDVGRTIVLVGVGVATLRENATVLDADYALVGRGLDRDDDLRFHEVRFQTTGLELSRVSPH